MSKVAIKGNPLGNAVFTIESPPTDSDRTFVLPDNTGTIITTSDVGTIASQDSDNVSISGGTITGITDLAVADGGTGASNDSDARVNLGLGNVDNVSAADLRDRSTHTGTQELSTISDAGTLASQDAGNVNIDGGNIDGTPIGVSSASSGAFTNLSYTGTLTGGTGVVNIGSGQIYKDVSGNVEISNSIQAEGSIRIGNGFGSGGSATIHNFQKSLYLQFNNGNSEDTLRLGGGGTICDLVFHNNEGGISPNDDTGWISVSSGFSERSVSHSISLPYHVIPLVRAGTAGSYNSIYDANDIIQSGFNFPNSSGLNATGLYFISNDNQIEFFEHFYVGAANSNNMQDGFVEINALRFLIFKIGQVSL